MLSSTRSTLALAIFLSFVSSAWSHLLMTYPGWRGDNIHTTGYPNQTNGLGEYTLDNGTVLFPYGMQWMYPCGGMGASANRTNWPVKGGAVAFQPGWFQGHLQGQLYINLGIGTFPKNMSLPMLGMTSIRGPTNSAYPGKGVCFPQLPLPVNYTAKVGDNATIQVVLAAQHGAALYSCVDITFTEPEHVEKVTKDNCFNSSEIEFQVMFQTSSLTNAGSLVRPSIAAISYFPLLAVFLWGMMW